ncbi:MAG: hypothetical protein ACYDD1_06295 [Caulobacteraceae bacterium]
MTREEYLKKAKEAEDLAQFISLRFEKEKLLEVAQHWRLLAATTADAARALSPYIGK